MLGKNSPQRGMFEADNLYIDYVGRDTFYGFLASQRGKLFRDEDYAELYCPDNGRASVPPSKLSIALLLQAHDRVELLLDVDRDYATYFHLSVDHRGWAGESCMGDPSWNPKWYVAGRSDTTEWTAEAAISWKDLTPGKPGPPSVWAMGIQRVVPHVGFQSWSKPAAVRVMPQGFGYLLFR